MRRQQAGHRGGCDGRPTTTQEQVNTLDDLTGQIGIIRHGDTLISKLIEWDTDSHTHHVVVATSPTQCVSAEPGGVVVRTNAAYRNILWFRLTLTDGEKAAIVAAAETKLTLPYNYAIYPVLFMQKLTGIPTPQCVAAWLGRRRNVDCSQLADDIYCAAGIHLFPNQYSDVVTPGDFERLAIRLGYLKPGE